MKYKKERKKKKGVDSGWRKNGREQKPPFEKFIKGFAFLLR